MLYSKKPRMFNYASVCSLLTSSLLFSSGKDFMLEAINVLKGVGRVPTGLPCFMLSNHLARYSGSKTSSRRIHGRQACRRWGRLCPRTRAYNHNPFRHNHSSPAQGHPLRHQLPRKHSLSAQGHLATHFWIPLHSLDLWQPHRRRLKSEIRQEHPMMPLSVSPQPMTFL